MSDLPFYVWLLALAGVIGIPALTCVMLFRGALAAGLARGAGVRVAATAAVVLSGWIAGNAALAAGGAYVTGPGEPPVALAAALLGAVAALLLATRIPVIARILTAPGMPARLAVPQFLRVAGGVFVVALALGELPALFALPAGLGDVAVGVAALVVLRAFAAGRGHRPAVSLQLFGLLDLVVAVSLGIAIGTGLIAATPGMEPMALLPLILIPTTAVPLAAALHIISLRLLWASAPSGTPAGRRTAEVG